MTDLLIVGGGIMGLWAAVAAQRAGIETTLLERATIGAGASGGILGALMPHVPERWNPKKQFQFEALVSLEAEIAALEAETGLSAGYRRSGRLIPLANAHLRENALRHMRDALANWQSKERPFLWNVQDASPFSGWPDGAATESGVVFETLAARVSPRALLCMLEQVLRRSPRVRIREHTDVIRINPNSGTADIAGGEIIRFGHCILSAGVESFPLLNALHPGAVRSSGMAVKGQAALLEADVDPSWPVIFSDGLYIVPHENGRVAVGSTTENSFESPMACDDQIDALLARAAGIVPKLQDARVVERWAGLRPKAVGREPMVGRHPKFPRLLMLTGGFKVSFGLAHLLAASVVATVVNGDSIEMPQTFRCSQHIDLMHANPQK